ncbi:hypothetical protein [Streptomyces sp. NPDC002386]
MIRPALAHAWQRLQRRGLTLLITGIAWISYGASIATQPRYGTVRGIGVLLDLQPMYVWAWVWLGSGLASIAFCAARPGRDRFGIAAAIVPPLLWAVAYALGATIGGYAQAWGAVAPWASHAVVILIVVSGTRPRKVVMVHHE